MNKTCIKKIILICIIMFSGIQLYAQVSHPTRDNKGWRHRGFYLSYAPGINLTNVKMTDKFGSTTFKGPGVGNDFKIGGTLKENLIIHATLLGHGVYEPRIYDENTGQNGTKADKIDFGELMIGGGITYYTPENFLFSSSVGFGGFSLTDEKNNEDNYTDRGFSLQAKAGKEWWVLPKFGLGLAVYYHCTNVLNQKGGEDEERIKSNNFGIVLNATLNGK
jgi:hypothetical protein